MLSGLGYQACSKSGNGPVTAPSSPMVGGFAPDFLLKDVTGNDVKLSEYRGKIVLLEFWATWCPPCKATVPELVAIQDKYRDKGLVVLGVSLDEGQDIPAKLADFSGEYKVNYRILIGTEAVSRSYNVSGIPMSFLIDREGRIINSYVGYIDKLEAGISSQVDKAI